MEKRKDGFVFQITVPANTRATVYIPVEKGESVLESGLTLGQAKDVKFLRKEDECFVCAVGSGSYSFKSKK